MTVDPYSDPAYGVLRNRYGITDPDRLRVVEADLTAAALADLGTRILPGGYDLVHLRLFHAEIFGDLYPWAGEIRRVGEGALPAKPVEGRLHRSADALFRRGECDPPVP